MFPDKKISYLEGLTFIVCLTLLIIVCIFEFKASAITEKYPLTFSVIAGIFSGILSAIALLYFQEKHHVKSVNKYYSEIAGTYTRIDIGQDNTGEAEIGTMKEQNLGLHIHLKHINGTHSLKFKADYWRNENALVEGTLEFNEKNGNTANGRYRYTRASANMLGHSGTYKIYRLEEDYTKLLVLFHHHFPRQLVNNPDNNRGWEIWQKVQF